MILTQPPLILHWQARRSVLSDGTKSRALIASGASAEKCRRRRGASEVWAMNLKKYDAAQPRRFVGFYEQMASGSAVTLAHASVTK